MTIHVAAVQLWSDIERTPDENREHAVEMLAMALRGLERRGQSESVDAGRSDSGVGQSGGPTSAFSPQNPTSHLRRPPSDLVVLPEAVA